DEYNYGVPPESALYLKRQRNSEAITFLTTVQPNNVVTNSDFVQEQFEIERLPRFGYHRIGDSLGNDQFTFFSDNMVERVRFNVSGADLGDQGFRFKQGAKPGIPSLGRVGETGLNGAPMVGEDFTDRGD